MPKALHDKLAREANAKGLTGNRKNAYIYGTLDKIEKGKPKKKKKKKKRSGSFHGSRYIKAKEK